MGEGRGSRAMRGAALMRRVSRSSTWKRWVHALFQVRVTTRLLYELDTVADIRTYP